MAKRLFLLLFSAFLGIFIAPDFLIATDIVPLNQPEFNAVETIEKKPQPITEPAPVTTYTATKVNSAPVATPAYTPPPVNYTVSYYIGSIEQYTNTALNLSYNGLYKFRKMIYGHNTYNLLGNLGSRSVGETITITEGGVASKYRIAGIQVYRKTADGYLEGNSRLMNDIANTAMGHDVALLTCHGTNYGNGDASHRLVVFANRI